MVLLSGLGLPSCVALNGAYDEDGPSTGGAGTGVVSTRGLETGLPSGMVSTDSNGATTDIPGVTSVGDSGVTSIDPSGEPTTAGDTGQKFDLGPGVCSVEPGGACNAYGAGECIRTEACRPYDAQGDGEVAGARCFPQGEVPELEACEPACSGDPALVCSDWLVCDEFSSVDDENGRCRPLCTGSMASPSCADGLCFQYSTADGLGFGICRGDCNPTGGGVQCGAGQTCAIRQDAPTPTCRPEPAVGAEDNCSASECSDGQICMSAEALTMCEFDWCCVDICDPPATCPGGGACNTLPGLGGATLDIGFCDP